MIVPKKCATLKAYFIMALLKSKKFWIVAIIILLIIFVFSRGGDKGKAEISSTIVEKTTLVQSVSETGSVSGELDISYGWEINGRVANISKIAGAEVKKGDIIAELQNVKQRSSLAQAVAQLKSAEAALNLKLAGATNEDKLEALALVDQRKATLEKVKATASSDVFAAEKAVDTAKNNLQLASGGDNSEIVNNAYDDLINTLKSSITAVSDALTESDNILGIDNAGANDAFEQGINNADATKLSTAQDSYRQTRDSKDKYSTTVFALKSASPHKDVDDVTPSIKSLISDTQSHLLDMQNMLNSANVALDLSQTELNTLKSNINTVLTTVNTASTNLTNDVQAVTTAKNSLSGYQIAYDKAVLDLENTKTKSQADIDIAEANVRQSQAAYDSLVAGPRDVDLGTARADVNKNKANVQSAQHELDKTILKALADGVVAKIDVSVGENVTALDPIVTLVSAEKSIEVDISESDIAKISIDDKVMITLDAFGDEIELAGKVISIEPGETEVSGVIYYKTGIVFTDTKDLPIRSGMTANLQIITDTKDNVLIVPQRSIIREDGKKYIRILTNKEKAEFDKKEVTDGIRGDNGLIEILSGVAEGDEIITFIKEQK